MLASAALGLLRFNSLQTGASYDDAHYIILAESMAGGRGYELINFPQPQIERVFPPGWPVLLTPFTFFFPGNYTILKILTWILWLVSLPLMYKLFSKRIESPYREILLGLIALNPFLVGTSVTVMSESAYLFFSLLVFILFDSSSSGKPNNYWIVVWMAVAVLYGQLIRAIGISIFIALTIYFLFTRRFREAAITLGIFGLGMLIQFWLNLRNGGSVVSAGYETQVFNGSLVEKAGQMWITLLGYFNEIAAGALVPAFGEKVTALIGPALPMIGNVVIILMLVVGFLLACSRIHPMDIYVLIYLLGVLAYWNPVVGSVKVRYLIPIIPFLYFYFVQGLKWMSDRLTKNNISNSARFMFGVIGVVLLILLARNIQDWRYPVRNRMADLSIGAGWVAENAPADVIIMVNEPVPAYIQVRRKTVGYPRDLQSIEKYVVNQEIDYIIISPELEAPRSTNLDEDVETQLLPILNGNPNKFVIVYRNAEYNVTVYQVED